MSDASRDLHPFYWVGEGPVDGFTKIPNELAQDGRLSASARSVALLLWSLDAAGTSVTSLAARLRMKRDTVSQALRALQDARWIVVLRVSPRHWEFFAHPARRLTEAEVAECEGVMGTRAEEFRNSYQKALHGRQMSSGEYRTLVTLLDHAEGDGTHAHPGIATMAKACGTSERTVETHLKNLVAAGYISISSPAEGRNKDYRFMLPKLRRPDVPSHWERPDLSLIFRG